MHLLPFEDYVRSLPKKRMSAGVVFHADERVLLIHPTYKPTWDIPGGVVDHGEAPWTTAAREVMEEIGWEFQPGDLLVIDHIAEGTDGYPEGLAFLFNGGPVSDEHMNNVTTTDPEIGGAGLYTLAEARDHLTDALRRRLEVALRSIDTGATVLCTDGKPAAYA